jgi:hypothetical protein
MKYPLLTLLLVTALSASSAPPRQTFLGAITDDVCPMADHSIMQMGPTAKDCTHACIDIHGASYVLYDGKNTYQLSNQKMPDLFAGQKVKVVGTLDAKTKTIQVDSITAAK